MDQITRDEINHLTAQIAAQGFLIDALCLLAFANLPGDVRTSAIKSLYAQRVRPDQSPLSENDAVIRRLADEYLDRLIDRLVERLPGREA
jgi:hypothetical protein